MTQRLKFVCFMLLAAAAAWVMPAAKADQWNKLTVMTFNEAVEIPGQILPAGTYVFKLIDSQADRTVVQVLTEDQTRLIATIMAVPDYRLQPTGDTALKFEERPAGLPEALHSWFYPGDNYGLEFVYKKSEQQSADRSEPAAPVVETATAAPTPEPAPAPVPVVTAVDTSSSESAVVSEGTFIIGDAVPAAPADSGTAAPALPETLPQTAGNFIAVPLFGMLLLCAGLTGIRFAAKLN
jgi:hypothetical protein